MTKAFANHVGSKQNWRKVALARRQARKMTTSPTQRHEVAERLAQILLSSPLEENLSEAVAVYVPFASEPDVSSLTESLLARGVSVLVPNLDFPKRRGERPFTPLEPEHEPTLLGTIILPALAFDNSGARLGRGGGWYDRAIESVAHAQGETPLLIGVCFDDEFFPSRVLPSEPHDVPVDLIATPSGLIWTV